MTQTANHLLVELYNCEPDRITDEKYIERILKESLLITDTKIINSLFCKQGEIIMGAVFFAEGSYIIHSWSTGYIGLDFYSNNSANNTKALEFLIRKFAPTKYSASEILRGDKLEETK